MVNIRQNCPLAMRIINIIAALLLIGFGIAGIVLLTTNNVTSGKFFLLFSPIFMILLGFLFFAAEFQIQCIMKHVVFLKSYVGRGVFNLLYIFFRFSMASTVFFYFQCENDNEVVAWIAAILIFVLGLFYIVVGLCCSSKDKDEEDQLSTQRNERTKDLVT